MVFYKCLLSGILLSQCLLSETDKRPNFDMIVSSLSSLNIDEAHWEALKPLWREIPLDYTYDKEEEDGFITRRELFTSTAKRWEDLIDNPEYEPVHKGLRAGVELLEKYYCRTDDTDVYFIAHGKI